MSDTRRRSLQKRRRRTYARRAFQTKTGRRTQDQQCETGNKREYQREE